MLISKFDLYKTEWLDLVFDNRNKEYGAYDLRQHYAGNMVKAMGITFFGVALLCGAVILFTTVKPVYHVTVVDVHPYVIPAVVPPIKKIEPPAPVKPLKVQPPAPTVTTTRFVPLVVKQDPETINPPKIDELNGAIGTETVKGTPSTGNVLPTENTGPTGTGPDNSIHLVGEGLDVMPEPVGGMNAWSKFLNKNLRFPPAAQDENISGRVILSFIIEKDGTLSNIVVERPAGHGFDEEALRVLKLAKAWKPGKQNGQPVRVRYSIPINFQLSTD